MRLLQFIVGNQLHLGIQIKQGIVDLTKAGQELDLETPRNMQELIQEGEAGWQALQQLLNQVDHSVLLDEAEIEYAPVVTGPEKIICIGLNYINHAAESKMNIPQTPILFSKFNNALAAHKEQVRLPLSAEKFDYEGELVIVMGKPARSISPAAALDYVFGYSIGNDLSARDLQFRSSQWLLGKSCDQFAPLGPVLVTADELADPQNLEISCRVNGELRQSASTKDMIFSCAEIISYISNYMTLKPGDLIFTGTPEGVILGYPESEQVWLKDGDEIAVAIEKIGTLVSTLQLRP